MKPGETTNSFHFRKSKSFLQNVRLWSAGQFICWGITGAGGKPSTWFPPGGLVEPTIKINNNFNIYIFFKLDIFTCMKTPSLSFFINLATHFDIWHHVWSGFFINFQGKLSDQERSDNEYIRFQKIIDFFLNLSVDWYDQISSAGVLWRRR